MYYTYCSYMYMVYGSEAEYYSTMYMYIYGIEDVLLGEAHYTLFLCPPKCYYDLIMVYTIVLHFSVAKGRDTPLSDIQP